MANRICIYSDYFKISTVCANNNHSINKWNLKIPKRCVCVRDVKNGKLNTPMLRLLLEQNIFAINLLKHQLGSAKVGGGGKT